MADRVRAKQWFFKSILAAMICVGSPSHADVTIRSLDGKVSISGELVEYTDEFFMLRTTVGILKMVRASVECEGADCPVPEQILMLANAKIGSRVKIIARDKTMTVIGVLTSFERQDYGLDTEIGPLKIPAYTATCEGDGCPVEKLVNVSDLAPELLEVLRQSEAAALATPKEPPSTQIASIAPVTTAPVIVDSPAQKPVIEAPQAPVLGQAPTSPSVLFAPSTTAPQQIENVGISLPGAPKLNSQPTLHTNSGPQIGLSAPLVETSSGGFTVPQLDGSVKTTAFVPPAPNFDGETALLITPPKTTPVIQDTDSTAHLTKTQMQVTAPAWVNASILPELLAKFAASTDSTIDGSILTRSDMVIDLNISAKEDAALKAPINIELGAQSDQTRRIVLGHSAHVAIVSNDNVINDLTLPQLRDIISGRYSNWAQLGETRADLKLLSLTSDTALAALASTTYSTFKELDAAVAKDPLSIAFVPYRPEITSKMLPIAESCGLVHAANEQTVQNGDYPISQSLGMTIAADIRSGPEAEFFEFVSAQIADNTLGDTGLAPTAAQRWILDTRATRLKAQRAAIRDTSALPRYDQLLDLMGNSDALSSVFRFRGSSMNLDDNARMQLSSLITYLSQNDGISELILVGFSDDVGSFSANTLQSQRRADAIARHLADVDISGVLKDIEIKTVAMSEFNPVSCNQNSHGRARNRRVEVWVKK